MLVLSVNAEGSWVKHQGGDKGWSDKSLCAFKGWLRAVKTDALRDQVSQAHTQSKQGSELPNDTSQFSIQVFKEIREGAFKLLPSYVLTMQAFSISSGLWAYWWTS